MDTRWKIVPLASALEQVGQAATIVTGYFDPLTAAHVRRLRELRGDSGGLVVVILDPPDPLVPARARAELVAGLACVDFVAIGDAAPDAMHEEEADLLRRDELIERVRARHEVA